MLIQELKEVLQDQADIFQDTFFQSSQINLLTITCRIQHTSYYENDVP